MAKISARGATKVASWKITTDDSTSVYTLCSDGRLLTKREKDTYVLHARLPHSVMDADPLGAVERYLARRLPESVTIQRV